MLQEKAGDYVLEVKKNFEAHRNGPYSIKMKKYMRNQFEFIGMRSEQRKLVQRKIINNSGVPDAKILDEVVYELWDLPEREYQYFAMELLTKRVKKSGPEIIPLIESLILKKSWWDTIDWISPGICGVLFRNHPEIIKPVTRRWMDSGNIWLQRTCILFQLMYKKDTDLKLLYSFIDQLSHEKEFFIKKAIGWALRQYSKTDPSEVKRFIESRELQPLSVREGMKYVK